jgi:hypothetical protein
MQALDADFKANPQRRKSLSNKAAYEETAEAAVRKAYRLAAAKPADVRAQGDILHSCSVFHKLVRLFEVIGWRQPYLGLALNILVDLEEPDALVAKFSEVCDRAERCSSAQRQAFNLLVAHACLIKDNSKRRVELLESQQSAQAELKEWALYRFKECFEDFLDDHKERAFKSAFMEPARFYFHAVTDHGNRDHVNVHGLNWYLAMLHSTAGIQLPLMPEFHDPHVMGVADFWAGLSDDAWKLFSDPSHFGADFEGIPQLCRKPQSFVKKRLPQGEFPQGLRTDKPKALGNAAVDPASGKQKVRKSLALYLERFAYFFSSGFFVRKAFETLNAEVKPEHVGFRKACEILFPFYREEMGIAGESFLEHCYNDEYFMELSNANVEHFFAWLGVVKINGSTTTAASTQQKPSQTVEPKAAHPQKVSAYPVTCPICCEQADDVAVLDHWRPQGDISEHKMCGKCRSRYGKNQCPFCKEILLKDELLGFISDFVDTVAKQADGGDPNLRAAVLERWQLFEMEYESQPAVIMRIAKLIVEDAGFIARLDKGLKQNQDWLRDTAGILFRFHCLCKDGELKVDTTHQKRLAKAVEAIIAPFEAKNPVSLDAHFYGALYTQALVPWLCAWRSGSSTASLCEVVRRVGKAVVHCYHSKGKKQDLRQRIPERMHAEYIVLSHEPIWGSRDADVIWQNFYNTNASKR